ncbi:MAG: hypothetical protein P1V34_13820 [Alphaproteobacteria bacterium]|nr:hypothetical protein [Alphaproteobacteria bacterium]
MPTILNTIKVISPVREIRFEAERRIAMGILVNGSPFRCDDVSMQRVGEIVQAFGEGLVAEDGVRFSTAAGVMMTLKSETQVRSIFDAMRRYRSACLAASALLQSNPPANSADDSYWPGQEIVAL